MSRKILSVILLLLTILFSSTALADVVSRSEYDEPKYVEGEVIVEIEAPLSSDYPTDDAYAKALFDQAEAFASKYGFGFVTTYPDAARITGKNAILLRSAYKSANEMIQELSSDPDVMRVEKNYIGKWTSPADENRGCNVGGSTMLLLLVSFLSTVLNRIKISL